MNLEKSSEKVNKIIGGNVKKAISDSGYKCKIFPARLGLGADAFSKRLSGKRNFTAYELAKIASIIGVNEAVFFVGIDNSPVSTT